MADNRVVIKINYDKDKRRKEIIDPKMVTVWHKGRIFGAIATLVFLISLIFFWFSGEETQENKEPEVKVISSSVPVPTVPADAPQTENIPAPAKPDKPVSPQSMVRDSKRPPAIIFNKKVIRASLNTAPRYGEPGEPMGPRVIIKPDQTNELFYFSEVKRMQEQVMFHKWYKNGEMIYKKQFKVKTDKSKLISSKKITGKDTGEWQVMLIDNEGNRYSEVNFFVNP